MTKNRCSAFIQSIAKPFVSEAVDMGRANPSTAGRWRGLAGLRNMKPSPGISFMARLVVKHHRPHRTWVTAAVGAAAILTAVWAAFVYGEYRAGFDRQAAVALKDALADAQERADALNDQITALQRQRTVDQDARQQVQATLEELQRKQADL